MTTHTETFGKGYLSLLSLFQQYFPRYKQTQRNKATFCSQCIRKQKPMRKLFQKHDVIHSPFITLQSFTHSSVLNLFDLNPHNPKAKAPIHWHKNMFSLTHTGYRLALLVIEKNGMKYFKLSFESSLSDKLNCCYCNTNKTFFYVETFCLIYVSSN